MKFFYTFLFITTLSIAVGQQLNDSIAFKHLDSLLSVSKNLREIGELVKSLELERLVQREALEKFGRNSTIYGNSCISMGKWHLAKSEYLEAEKYYFEAIAIFKKVYGVEHNLYAKALNNLGVLYYWMGNFEKCEPIYLQVRDLQEKAVGRSHIDFAVSLNNLALLYKELGRYDKAEPFYKESYELIKKILGENHPQYARSVTNLGVFYFIIGDYEKAEPLYLESKRVREQYLGKKHPDYGVSLTNLGTLYSAMGNLTKAERFYLEATQIFEMVFGKNHSRYAQSLYNLASLYNDFKKDSQALILLLEARTILLTALGTKHPDYVNCIHLLAHAYKSLHNMQMAEQLHLEALEIQKAITGKEHTGYSKSLMSLAKLYMDTNRDSLAEPLITEAQSIIRSVVGIDYSEYSTTLRYLALFNEKNRKYKQVDLMMNEYLELDFKKLSKSVHYLSSEELNKYAESVGKNSETLLSFIYRRKTENANSDALNKMAFNTALFQKGFVLHAASRLNLLSGETNESKELNATLQAYKRRLTKEYAKSNKDRNVDEIMELEDKANSIEKELAQKIQGYSEALSQVKWEAIKLKLLPGEAVLEFVNFRLSFPKKTDSLMYAVLLIRVEDSVPVFIPLFEEKQLSLILNLFPVGTHSTLYASRGASPVILHNHSSLYELVWKPIDSFLMNIDKIYLTASGMLHRLNFNAMEVVDGSTLGDRYKLVQLGSSRQLAHNKEATWNQTSVVLFGGINFDSNGEAELDYPNAHNLQNLNHISDTSMQKNIYTSNWNYLPGTDTEIRNIYKQFLKSKIPVIQYRDKYATEAILKKLGNGKDSPRVLHIATHGYFLPEPKVDQMDTSIENSYQTSIKYSKQPMLRSGLVFAGGNKAWQGVQTKDGQEDGILTAYEISQMNLSNTELVVLSACETGLGDIQGNEGVYGLQRAFKIAGVKYLIMSLWQVPDTQTSLLMTTFYKMWLGSETNANDVKKNSIPDAFRAAQKELRDLGLDPYQWAGFVLVE
ncbi:MAG: CHAT domain-containing protein [Saprospiraceae bacterium]|nr:CHAT domain-containing protein [Saprospiraceae bacterium]